MVTLLIVGATGCSDDFLSASSTEKQEGGAPAYEGAILANLAAAYQILLFDSYANQNYNSLPLMSDLRSDDILKGVATRVTSASYTCSHFLPPHRRNCPKGCGASSTPELPGPTTPSQRVKTPWRCPKQR